ncbi:MAG: hypothetical protein ACK5GN_07320 [Pseudomonadota bacterium]
MSAVLLVGLNGVVAIRGVISGVVAEGLTSKPSPAGDSPPKI